MANVKVKREYLIAIAIMLVFVLNDLIFDFLFSFNGSDYIAFACTVISSIIVFVYTRKIRKSKILDDLENTTKFIKSNFDNCQVIFSILDIICGIISILSGIMMLNWLFKVVKGGYIPTKIIVVANKEKSVIKGVIKFAQCWTVWRMLTSKGEKSMFKKIWEFFKRNKLTILVCLIGGGLTGFTGYTHSAKYFALPMWANILIACAVALFVIVVFAIMGGENAKEFLFRLASKSLNEDNYKKVVGVIEQCQQEQVLQAEQEKETAKMKQESLLNAQEELKAKQDAELQALAEKKFAELQSKKQQQNTENK